MPIKKGTTTLKGKKVGYYKFGEKGTKYPYTLGNEKSRKAARELARIQGAAIKASQSRRQ